MDIIKKLEVILSFFKCFDVVSEYRKNEIKVSRHVRPLLRYNFFVIKGGNRQLLNAKITPATFSFHLISFTCAHRITELQGTFEIKGQVYIFSSLVLKLCSLLICTLNPFLVAVYSSFLTGLQCQRWRGLGRLTFRSQSGIL